MTQKKRGLNPEVDDIAAERTQGKGSFGWRAKKKKAINPFTFVKPKQQYKHVTNTTTLTYAVKAFIIQNNLDDRR